MNPEATLLGKAQRDWLFKGLEKSSAGWNVLAQQIMMARVDRVAGAEEGYSMDQWPGYEMERRRVLRHFAEKKIKNPVVLTGDIHNHWANELVTNFDRPDAPPVATEFVGTSISSGGDGVDAPKTLPELLSENPWVKFHNNQRGYVRCEVTPGRWKTDFQVVDFVTKKGSPARTRASFVVESGRAVLNKA